MLKKINDILTGIPATVIAGFFLLLDLVPRLLTEFGYHQWYSYGLSCCVACYP